jgi:hypothetical protein
MDRDEYGVHGLDLTCGHCGWGFETEQQDLSEGLARHLTSAPQIS